MTGSNVTLTIESSLFPMVKEILVLRCGVPQASPDLFLSVCFLILLSPGPLLFIILVNDPQYATNMLNLIMFLKK